MTMRGKTDHQQRWIVLGLIISIVHCTSAQLTDDAVGRQTENAASQSPRVSIYQNTQMEGGQGKAIDGAVQYTDASSFHINNDSPKYFHVEATNCSGIHGHLIDAKGPMITTTRNIAWSMTLPESVRCLKPIFIGTFAEILLKYPKNLTNWDTLESCSQFIRHPYFVFKYIRRGDKTLLWYPTFECRDQCKANKLNLMQEYFHNCKMYLDMIEELMNEEEEKSHSEEFSSFSMRDLKGSLMPSIPWACPKLGKNTNWTSKYLADLWIINETLPKACGDFMCHGEELFPNLVAFYTNDSTNLNLCKKSSTFVSDETTNEYQIYFSFDHAPRNLVFMNYETSVNNRNKTIAKILLKLAKTSSISEYCNDTFNLKLTSSIVNVISNFYFFCYGSSTFRSSNESWIIETVTERGILVAMNRDVISNDVINLNIFLQKLIFANVSIPPSIYHDIANLSYTEIQNDNYFDITIIKVKPKDIEIVRKVASHMNITLKMDSSSIQHFILSKDKTSLRSQKNWIATYNCSVGILTDDKPLLLFLGKFSREEWAYICQDNISVIITSVAKEIIPYLNATKFKRNCSDPGIDHRISKGCNTMIRDATDYETRFFHFLIYPLNLTKQSAMKQLFQQFNKYKTTKQLPIQKLERLSFELLNTHPPLDFGITKLEVDDNSDDDDEYGESGKTMKEASESLKKTMQIFIIASLTNNSGCLQDLEQNKFSIDVSDDPNQPQYVIGPISADVNAASCLNILPVDIYENLETSNKSNMIRINKFWTCRFFNKIISWKWNNTTTHVADWDYLSGRCMFIETSIIIICLVITIITILGNATVLLILIYSGLAKGKFMLHTSLAAADLLLGISAASMAVYEMYSLRHGSLTLYHLDEKGSFANFQQLELQQPYGFKQVRFERYGWPVVSSIMMSISVYASLWTLAIFSIECLVLIESRPHDPHDVRHALCITWLLSICCAVLVNYREVGWHFVGYFDPITKITLNIGTGEASPSLVVTNIQVAVAGLAGLTVLVASISALIIYRREENKKLNQHQDGKNHIHNPHSEDRIQIHDEHRREKIKMVTTTFVLMVILLLISAGPLSITLLLDLSHSFPSFYFWVWWIFMAGASWNWILYTFRGQEFRMHAKQLFCRNKERDKERRRRGLPIR